MFRARACLVVTVASILFLGELLPVPPTVPLTPSINQTPRDSASLCALNLWKPYAGAVLPAAVERLLKHWETLDKAAGEGITFLQTLRSLLRVRVSEDGEDSALTTVVGRPVDGRGSSTGGTALCGDADFCQWLLSRSLSSEEASCRPSLAARTASATVWRKLPRPSRDSGRRRREFLRKSPLDDELTARVIRSYRSFAHAGLFGIASGVSSAGGGNGEALHRAAGLWRTVLCLPEGLRPASENRANAALRLAIDLGLPATTTTSFVKTGGDRASAGGGRRMDGSTFTAAGSDEERGKEQSYAKGATAHNVELPQHEASILAGLLDVYPAKRAGEGADGGASATREKPRLGVGATRGALFYRRFLEPVHEALLKRGGK